MIKLTSQYFDREGGSLRRNSTPCGTTRLVDEEDKRAYDPGSDRGSAAADLLPDRGAPWKGGIVDKLPSHRVLVLERQGGLSGKQPLFEGAPLSLPGDFAERLQQHLPLSRVLIPFWLEVQDFGGAEPVVHGRKWLLGATKG